MSIDTHGVLFERPGTGLVEETLTTILETEFIYGDMILDPDTTYHVYAYGFTCYSNMFYWWGDESNVLGPVYTYVDAKREIMNGPTASMLNLADWSGGYKDMYEGHTYLTFPTDYTGKVPHLYNGGEKIMFDYVEEFNMEHQYHGTFTGYSGTLNIRWPLVTQVWQEGWDPFAPAGDGVTFVVTGGNGQVYVYNVSFGADGSGILRHGVINE